MGILETKVISPPSQITLYRNIISPVREVKNTRGTQGQSVENPRPALLDRSILVLAAQDIRLVEKTQWFEMAAMLLVELVPLGCNLLVEFLAEFWVLGLLGVVGANVHRILSPLTVIVKVAAKIPGSK